MPNILKKIWKKTRDSAVIFNHEMNDSFCLGSEYIKMDTGSLDGFVYTIEDQRLSEKVYIIIKHNFKSSVSNLDY